jgi:hypothetical protein
LNSEGSSELNERIDMVLNVGLRTSNDCLVEVALHYTDYCFECLLEEHR